MVRKTRLKRARVSKRNVLGNTRSRVANKKSRVANKKSRVANRKTRVANRKIRGKNTRRLTGGGQEEAQYVSLPPLEARRGQGAPPLYATLPSSDNAAPPPGPHLKSAEGKVVSGPRQGSEVLSPGPGLITNYGPGTGGKEDSASADGDYARPMGPKELALVTGGKSGQSPFSEENVQELEQYFLAKALEALRAETAARAEADSQKEYLLKVIALLGGSPELKEKLNKVASLKSVARSEAEAKKATLAPLPTDTALTYVKKLIEEIDRATNAQKIIFQETKLKKNAIMKLLDAQSGLADDVNQMRNVESKRAEEAAKAEDAEKEKAEARLEEIKKKTFAAKLSYADIRTGLGLNPISFETLGGLELPVLEKSREFLETLLTPARQKFDNNYDPSVYIPEFFTGADENNDAAPKFDSVAGYSSPLVSPTPN